MAGAAGAEGVTGATGVVGAIGIVAGAGVPIVSLFFEAFSISTKQPINIASISPIHARTVRIVGSVIKKSYRACNNVGRKILSIMHRAPLRPFDLLERALDIKYPMITP